MQELIPIAEGLLLGGMFCAVRMRTWLRLVLLLVFGVGATIVSGELRLGWGFLLVDVVQIWAACAVVVLLDGFRRHFSARR
jgi:hypothetical protein